MEVAKKGKGKGGGKRKRPCLVAAVLGLISSVAIAGGATLSWNPSATDPANVTGYKVYRGTTSGTYQLSQTLGRVTTATEASLTAGTKYFWVVTAFNSGGESAYSNEASATIPFVVPAAATGLNAVGIP